VPGVVREYSSRRLLVMEWVDGVKLTDLDGLRRAGHDRQALADLLLDTYCRQILIDGSFHADPHPGNLFALPGGRLAIVDFGLTKRLGTAFRRSLAKMTGALFTGNLPVLVEAFDELGYRVTRGEDQAVYAATAEFFQTITDPSTHADGPASMEAINRRWIQAVKQNPIVAIPGDTTLVWRVFALLMGVGASMGARPHVVETVLKYTEQVSREREAERERTPAADAAAVA
jgi:ubiquinone biosynthesis protein